jgi:hypothetical protein
MHYTEMEVLDVQGYALVKCLVVHFSKGLLIHGLHFFDRFSYLLLSFPNHHECVCPSARASIANDLAPLPSPRKR